MSTISTKEKRILWIGLVVVLYGIAALCYKVQMPSWKKEHKAYQTAEKKLQDERALIAARDKWKEKYEDVREHMPTFAYEKDMKTHWERIMGSTASDKGLTIGRTQSSDKEIEVGGVYEQPIDCKDWEGTLDSLIEFLYALSIEKEAMLDVRQLYVRPINKPGVLKGTFTLYCAYMRGN